MVCNSHNNLIPPKLIEPHLIQNLKLLHRKKMWQKQHSLPPSYCKFQSTEASTKSDENLALEYPQLLVRLRTSCNGHINLTIMTCTVNNTGQMKGTNGRRTPGSPVVPHLQNHMDAALPIPQHLSVELCITPMISTPELFQLNRQRKCLIDSAPFIHSLL